MINDFLRFAGIAFILTGCVAERSDLSAPCVWREFEGESVEITRNGRMLPIIVDERPENRWAAWFLADTIEEMCGLRPPTLVGDTDSVSNGLFVCSNGAPADDEGFRVIARDGSVRFQGRSDYAVFDWCERALGMRYYCLDGKCVEKRDEIVVRAVDYSDRPVFEHRRIGGSRTADWVRVAKSGSAHRGGVNVHAPHGWFRDAQLKAEHPGIFETGETPMLCYGNPETLAYYKYRIDRAISGVEGAGGIVNTDRKIVTVCQWDAPVRCTCPYCRSLYAYGDSLRVAPNASPVIWGWFTAKLSAWLKAAHPDYMISFLPYLNTCGLEGVRGVEGCEAEVCTMPGLALLKNAACKRKEEDLLRGWRRVTGRKVLSWDYECWPKDFTSAPYVFGRTVQAHYADMRDVLCGAYVCGSAADPRTSVSTYVWMKCLWNPDFDVDRVYDEFARRMFGPAAEPMRELIALQEECWDRQWADDVCSYRNVFETSYPPEDILRLKNLMQKAYRIALEEGDEIVRRRTRTYLSSLERFITEAEANANFDAERTILPDAPCELRPARDVWATNVWAKTEVVTHREKDELRIRVKCFDALADKLDYTHVVDNFVWGNDEVVLVLDDGRGAKTLRRGLTETVARDAESWSVEFRVKLSAEALRTGRVKGNVCRWRVGDRKFYEHTRLSTRYTQPDDDPAALVNLKL